MASKKRKASFGKKAGLFTAGLFALGSLFPSLAHAESTVPQTYNEDNGVLVANDVFPIEKGKNYNINKMLRGGSFKGPPRIYAMDPLLALLNTETYLDSADAKAKYTDARRAEIKKDIWGLITQIDKYPRSPNYHISLREMSKGASNGFLTANETKNIEDNFYMLVKRGIKADGKKYSVEELVYVTSKDLAEKEKLSQYAEKINSLESNIRGLESRLSEAKSHELSKSEIENITKIAVNKYRQAQAAETAAEKAAKEKPSKPYHPAKSASASKKSSKSKKKEPFVRPQIGIGYSGYENTYYGSVGARAGKDNNLVNVSFDGNFGKGFSENNYTTTGPTSPAGLYGVGKINDSDFYMFGGDINLYIGRKVEGVVGTGIESVTYNESQTAQIKKGSQILSSNSSANKMHDYLLRFLAGVGFKVGKSKMEADLTLDYSMNQNKTYAGVEVKTTF